MIFGGRRWCTLSIHWPGRIGKGAKVLGPAEPLCLEAPHLAGRGGRAADRPVAHHPAHHRVAAQPGGVVHVLVAGEPPENRLAQQSGQPMTTILANARVGKHLSRSRTVGLTPLS